MSDLALLARSVRAENRIFWRTPIGAFFTLGLPLIMLVLFVALFGNESIGETAYGDITTAQFYAAGLAVFASASATYTNVAINLTMRRDDGVLKRIRSTPIPPWVFLSGVVLSGVWIAALSSLIMVGLGVAAYGITIDLEQVPAMLVAFGAGTVCFSSLGLGLAAMARTASGAPAVANATILPMAFVSDVFIRLDDPPGWLSAVGDVLPLKPFAVSFGQAMSPFTRAPAFEWDRLAVLGAWTVVGAVVAWRRFRWEPLPDARSRSRRGRRAGS